ncbi:MAG: hypothetical protein NTX59_12330 [Elusimicrobia bacterium]|nr:hypothetical protein [Elusimicrobiota bacterium]
MLIRAKEESRQVWRPEVAYDKWIILIKSNKRKPDERQAGFKIMEGLNDPVRQKQAKRKGARKDCACQMPFRAPYCTQRNNYRGLPPHASLRYT